MRSFTLFVSILLTTSLSAQEQPEGQHLEVLAVDVAALDELFTESKAERIAEVAVEIANRAIHHDHESVQEEIESLREEVGRLNAGIEDLDKEKLRKPSPVGVLIGVATIVAVVGLLLKLFRRRP